MLALMPVAVVLSRKFEALARVLDERTRRLVAAAEASAIGYGGVTIEAPCCLSQRPAARLFSLLVYCLLAVAPLVYGQASITVVVNGASFEPTVAPGSLLVIYGKGLASSTLIWSRADRCPQCGAHKWSLEAVQAQTEAHNQRERLSAEKASAMTGR
jgi:hypothetical protein